MSRIFKPPPNNEQGPQVKSEMEEQGDQSALALVVAVILSVFSSVFGSRRIIGFLVALGLILSILGLDHFIGINYWELFGSIGGGALFFSVFALILVVINLVTNRNR